MRVKVNDNDLYYQRLGNGHPVILIHGHHQDGAIFDKLVAPLSLYYTVYVPDMRGHGLSSGEASEHYQTDVEDLAEFMRQLGLKDAYILGYGAGGVAALLLANQYPHLVSKLIVAGTYVNGNGVTAGHITWNSLRGFLIGDRDSRVALKETFIDPRKLKQIQIPTLCVVGEKDWVKVEHVRWYSQLLPNSRLVIMPRQKHESYVVHSLKLLDLIKDFYQEK
ncbi:MAG: alpha/beta hydrolase [Lactobacillus sp.]|nr:alpha/beta hydrolase [Lactobacillus sp.]